LFERDPRTIRKITRKVNNIVDVGAAPRIDRLIFVADNAERINRKSALFIECEQL
jgi:hypothetical protein